MCRTVHFIWLILARCPNSWDWMSVPCTVTSKTWLKKPKRTESVISHGECCFCWALFGYCYSASCESINLYLSWPTVLHLVHHFIKCFPEIQMHHDLGTWGKGQDAKGVGLMGLVLTEPLVLSGDLCFLCVLILSVSTFHPGLTHGMEYLPCYYIFYFWKISFSLPSFLPSFFLSFLKTIHALSFFIAFYSR